MNYWKKIALCVALASGILGLGAVASAATTLTLNYIANTSAAPAKPGNCSGIAWIADKEYRMCGPSNAALGGGTSSGDTDAHKNAIFGGETHTFTNGVLTSVAGVGTNPGTSPSQPGSACPTASACQLWTQNAQFLTNMFGFLAPVQGSLAGNAYGGPATYIGGVPIAGSNIPFVNAPVLEAQWGGAWFAMGRSNVVGDASDTALGILFKADISNVASLGNQVTFDFQLYANEVINGTAGADNEDGGGFDSWTGQWHFQGSGTYVDTDIPAVSSTYPAASDTVPASLAEITVIYNKPMNSASITAAAITLSGGETVGAPVSYNGNQVFVFPITSSPLAGPTHTITFNAGPTDAGGTPVTAKSPVTFNVGGADSVAPSITERSPLPNATNVATTSPIVVTFNERMTSGTVGAITVMKTSDSSPVAGTAAANTAATSAANTIFTFSPTAALDNSTSYTVTVSGALAEDASGNNLGSNDVWSFTTAAAGDQKVFVLEDNGTPNGLLSGCTLSRRADFDPTILSMLLGSFGWLAWRRRRERSL